MIENLILLLTDSLLPIILLQIIFFSASVYSLILSDMCSHIAEFVLKL